MESRKSLCEFIEETCTHLINLYEKDRLNKVCIFKLNIRCIFLKLTCLGSRRIISNVNFFYKNSSS